MTRQEALKEKANLTRKGQWRGHKIVKLGDKYAIIYIPRKRTQDLRLRR